MDLTHEDLVYLGRFIFGDKPVKKVRVTYHRSFFSKIKIGLELEDGTEKWLRVYITKNKILIF
jgi:hypothetical protein